MTATAFGAPTYTIPVSIGILAHCKQVGAAIWTFLWMIDHTTKEARGTDERTEGLVHGGRIIRTADIAADLNISKRAVQAETLGLDAAPFEVPELTQEEIDSKLAKANLSPLTNSWNYSPS